MCTGQKTGMDEDDLNPYRGNVFKKVDLSGGEGNLRDSLGRIKMIPESDSDLMDRRNYQRAYAVNYLDGDSTSRVDYGYGVTTLISDESRVVKRWKLDGYALLVKPWRTPFYGRKRKQFNNWFSLCNDTLRSTGRSIAKD